MTTTVIIASAALIFGLFLGFLIAGLMAEARRKEAKNERKK